ncbi:uncharacterized protein LOC130691332 [Daphnia carinata]|uniref:uncharacterized protein LOC130691332 n=1 Tax=Daphnia carinata TaxID=120202 RepID=UPI0025795D69|nr:uncharacterized protein LOC130691332 [Daphnia carinata]
MERSTFKRHRVLSTEADNSKSTPTATSQLRLERNFQESSPSQGDGTLVKSDDKTLLRIPLKERIPNVEHEEDNGNLYYAYTEKKNGKPVLQYLSGNPEEEENKKKNNSEGQGNKKKENSEKKQKRNFFKGVYNYNCDVLVAIVKTLLVYTEDQKKEIERECRILKELEAHENFIRYFTHRQDENYMYLAVELCLCSVADLLDRELNNQFCMDEEILSDLPKKEILRQATRGLNYLHENNFVHRNIKPNNFLIKEVDPSAKSLCRYVVKITDFRLTRKHDLENTGKLSGSAASEGWEAPESTDVTKDLSTTLDVFILGCFYHYVLTAGTGDGKPKHPFGDTSSLRIRNLHNKDYSVYNKGLDFVLSDGNEDVVRLMELMLKFNESERPTLQAVLCSLYFSPVKDYDIYNKRNEMKPGHCVIFNQQFFKNKEQNRAGSDKDREKLKLMFHGSGIDTEVYENLESFDLISKIKNLAKRDWKDYGCFIVCLLSHGVENAIQCYDGRYVNYTELKNEFSLYNCPSLYGKPKIFIVQACQVPLSKNGDIFPHMWDTISFALGKWQSPTEVKWPKLEINPNYESKIRQDAMKYPPLMDFITIKAAMAGFEAFRNKDLGTFFINALCDTLSEEMKKDNPHHLEYLLKMSVQDKINAFSRAEMANVMHQFECKNQGEGQQQGVCQCFWQTMQWETCLSKNITFRNCAVKGKDVTPKPDSKKG